MEKISNIVRGSPRISSVDLKGSSAVRPGAPTFGRPVGESPGTMDRESTTASRAAALHAQMSDRRTGGPDQVVAQMASQFFTNRLAPKGPAAETEEPKIADVEGLAAEMDDGAQVEGERMAQPSGFTPRGSYVDVRA